MTTSRFVVVPFGKLSPEALSGLLEAYVNREGTDYGQSKPPDLAGKVFQVRQQLEEGSAVIVFDPQDQSCNIIPRHLLPQSAVK